MNCEKKRIMVVDDEANVTRMLKACLEHTGLFEVRAENSASHALAVASDFHPDLILLDVLMPEMDGGTLAAQFQQHPAFRNVRIMFLTAAITKEEVYSRGGMTGGLPFIAKPVDIPQLIGRLNEQLAA